MGKYYTSRCHFKYEDYNQEHPGILIKGLLWEMPVTEPLGVQIASCNLCNTFSWCLVLSLPGVQILH